jgi:hypothetical protein
MLYCCNEITANFKTLTTISFYIYIHSWCKHEQLYTCSKATSMHHIMKRIHQTWAILK